ncbi:MAG: hypothetical protein ABDH21_00680 [bacterium]
MNEAFSKLKSTVQYYKRILRKDPFIALNIAPINYMKNDKITVDSNPKGLIDQKELDQMISFIHRYAKEYLSSIISCFQPLPAVYEQIIKGSAKKIEGLETHRVKGFKISEPKAQIYENEFAQNIFGTTDTNKLKAAQNYYLSASHFKEKNYYESNKAILESYKYDPSNPYVINNLFITNYLLGKFDENQEILKIMAIFGFDEVEFFEK